MYFSLLMAEAVMAFYSNNILTQPCSLDIKHILHYGLQILGSGIGIAGILIICISNGFLLVTAHGKLGETIKPNEAVILNGLWLLSCAALACYRCLIRTTYSDFMQMLYAFKFLVNFEL
uniref:Cytochrome b561 domain-containing protein n=1 Tax=Glossina brevipalpis TaxID=37001 RepID=A0A1A9W6V1_9MUSC